MKVEIVYLAPKNRFAAAIEVPDEATIRMAIEQSGVLRQFPEINLEKQKVGVYGKVKPLTAALADGDRVEIYRPVTVDPATVPRRKMADEEAES